MPILQSLPFHNPAAGVSDNRLLTRPWTTSPYQIPFYCTIRAAQNGRPQFEVDPDKAREALKKLDQQLQSISEKPVTTPIKKAQDLGFEEFQIREEMPEISGAFLGYTAGALLLFTIFYNVLFYAVIQPAIDLPSNPTARVGAPK
ncbi:unnamed protein product [Rhodiola kirilowii]